MALPALPLQALSNTLWGLSKLGIQAPQLMEGIGQEARSQLIEFNSQNLANSVGGWVAGGLVDAVSCVSLGSGVCLLFVVEYNLRNLTTPVGESGRGRGMGIGIRRGRLH
jgi:hypothetical protein